MKATEVTAGPAESNGSLLPGLWRDSLHVTCGLTACTPGSAPGPTLGNEYGKTLPFFYSRAVPCKPFSGHLAAILFYANYISLVHHFYPKMHLDDYWRPLFRNPPSLLRLMTTGTAAWYVEQAGSMKRYDVRLSVCPSMGSQQQTRCCRFAAASPADGRCRSIAAAATGECGQCHVVSVGR